jgi:hypothetical protein
MFIILGKIFFLVFISRIIPVFGHFVKLFLITKLLGKMYFSLGMFHSYYFNMEMGGYVERWVAK